jgi:hypothetical protein
VVVPPEESSQERFAPVGPPCIYSNCRTRGLPVAQIRRVRPVRCFVVSKKQLNRTTSRDLTKTTGLSILGIVVSARRRGLPGTSCGLASQWPTNLHRGPVWGATASVGGGLPAAVADPAGPRAGGEIFHSGHLDTNRALCDYHVWSDIRNGI